MLGTMCFTYVTGDHSEMLQGPQLLLELILVIYCTNIWSILKKYGVEQFKIDAQV